MTNRIFSAAPAHYATIMCSASCRTLATAGRFYTDLGFRISDYFVDEPQDDDPLGLFMFRKNNPHDLVLLTRPGPQLHHFAYVVGEIHHLFRALDTAGAIGFARKFRTRSRPSWPGHVFYVYFRDPDGHRVEILPPPIQIIDLDDEPARWHSGNRFTWDLPPPKKWLHEASHSRACRARAEGRTEAVLAGGFP